MEKGRRLESRRLSAEKVLREWANPGSRHAGLQAARRRLGVLVALLGLFALTLASTTSCAVTNVRLPTKTYGVAWGDELVWMTPDRLTAALDDAKNLGATSVRLDVSWADVQWDGPNTDRWADLDRGGVRSPQARPRPAPGDRLHPAVGRRRRL